jgi:Ni,Fe-hydrogenase I cytochrome b subunit
MNWAFSFSLLLLFLACANQINPSRNLANLDKSEMLKLWRNSIHSHHTQGKLITLALLERIYLSSIDEEDFLEHFLQLNPANHLLTQKDYEVFFQTLTEFQESLKNKKKELKAKTIFNLVDELKQDLRE